MANKIYTVVKDGETLKELKTLAAAKKLADTENAEVLCDGVSVYLGDKESVEDTALEVSNDECEVQTPVEKPAAAKKYVLTAKMNIRKAPSKDAQKLGIAQANTVVEVSEIRNDWMCLTDGTFILYEGGRFARQK